MKPATNIALAQYGRTEVPSAANIYLSSVSA